MRAPWEHLNKILIQRRGSEVGERERNGHWLLKWNHWAASSEEKRHKQDKSLPPSSLPLMVTVLKSGD